MPVLLSKDIYRNNNVNCCSSMCMTQTKSEHAMLGPQHAADGHRLVGY